MSMTISAVVSGSKREGERLGVDLRHQWCPAMCWPIDCDVGVGDRRLVDELALRHDQDAVGELEHLVEVLRLISSTAAPPLRAA